MKMSSLMIKTNPESVYAHKKFFSQTHLEQVYFHWSTEELERQSAESADDSHPSAAEEEMSKEVTSASEVKVATDAPAACGSGDSEMAKSRKSRHASKEDKSTYSFVSSDCLSVLLPLLRC